METGTDQFVDATAEMEVELRLPLEVEMKPDWIARISQSTWEVLAWTLSVLIRERRADPNGAKPKWARHGLQLPHTPEPCRQLLGADVPGTRPTPIKR